MPLVFPIYGFNITKTITLGFATIQPRTTNPDLAEKWSKDDNTYHLTCVLITETVSEEFLSNLEAALVFIERMDVLIKEGKPLENNDPFIMFSETVIPHKRYCGGGDRMVGIDTYFPSSREKFIQCLFKTLDDKKFCESTQFKQLFFKCVEQVRQPRPFIEVSYFLLFSGLETFSRATNNDFGKEVAKPIKDLLTNYGFKVFMANKNELVRSVLTYTHLRNALFHNNEFVKEVNYNGELIHLRLFKYFFNFTKLTNLVVLRAIQFDDGYTNWNGWVDYQ